MRGSKTEKALVFNGRIHSLMPARVKHRGEFFPFDKPRTNNKFKEVKVTVKNKWVPIMALWVVLLFTSSLYGEPVDLEWDLYVGQIDSIAIERSQDLTTWTEIASLANTATTYTDDVGAGTWYWRVVAIVGSERSESLSGVWKTIKVIAPSALRTP